MKLRKGVQKIMNIVSAFKFPLKIKEKKDKNKVD
jgi:hypothetical protein